jgi:hypothetical protein
MWRHTFLWLVVFAGIVGGHAYGQTIPVKVQSFSPDDSGTARVKEALENSIELSQRFTLFTGHPIDTPKNGVLIEVHAVSLTSQAGTEMGTAFTLIARRPSRAERGYFRTLLAETAFTSKGNSVADQTLSFLANVSKSMAEDR